MRLCSYAMVHDYGFAPNPFWGYCTLATCTPNHQGIRLEEEDWIVGHSTPDAGGRIIHAMKVSAVLDLDDYFRDARFQKKKPSGGTWKAECGDNIYFRDASGEWKQLKATRFHANEKHFKKDTRYARVCAAEQFCYFGENAITVPSRFKPLLQLGRRGCKVNHDAKLVAAFILWLEQNCELGIHGNPRDLGEWATTADAENDPVSCSPPLRSAAPQLRRPTPKHRVECAR